MVNVFAEIIIHASSAESCEIASHVRIFYPCSNPGKFLITNTPGTHIKYFIYTNERG